MQEFQYHGSINELKNLFADCLDRYYLIDFYHPGIQYFSTQRLVILSYRHEGDFWTEKHVGLHGVYLWLSESDDQTRLQYQSFYGLAQPLMIPFVLLATCIFFMLMNYFIMPLNLLAGIAVGGGLLIGTAIYSLINPYTEEAEAQIESFIIRACEVKGSCKRSAA